MMADMAEEGLGASPLSPIQLNDRALLLPAGSYLNFLPNVTYFFFPLKPLILCGLRPFPIPIKPIPL